MMYRVRVLFPSPVSHPAPYPSEQEDFLRGRIKVNKKTGNIGRVGEGKEVTLSRDRNELKLEADIPFSKR